MENKLIYRVNREHSDGGYVIDHLEIMEYDENDTAERLAGTVDNRDRYNTDAADHGVETAARMGRVFSAMLAAGYTKFFDYAYRALSIRIRYQVYRNPEADRPDYCAPEVRLPGDLRGIRAALRLINRLGARIERKRAKDLSRQRCYVVEPRDIDDATIAQLQDVADALDHVGAVKVESWQAPADGWHVPPSYFVPVR